MRRVLITGAAGDIGSTLAGELSGDAELVLTDADPGAGRHGAVVHGLDVRDLDACTERFSGVDTVVHLAGAASPDSPWEVVLDLNIIGTRTVLEAARRAGVRRVVLASSNHVMGMYDRDGDWPVYTSQPVRPDSLYGVSKAFGETLGRYYHDAFGLEVVALRIGWSTGDHGSAGDQELMSALWLSERDTAQVVRCAIEAPVTFGIYYAVSDNLNRRWDITDTMVDLGYRPQDRWHEVAGRPEGEATPGGASPPPEWPDA